MNVPSGFTLLEILALFEKGTLYLIDVERLRDFQDLLLLQIDNYEAYIQSDKSSRIQRIYYGEDLKYFRRVSDEIAAILMAEFYAK